MVTMEDLTLYFYIACGIFGFLFILLFIFIGILFHKLKQAFKIGSNETDYQREMNDFCYTNPMIVPGEELSRRGFSMYRGTEPLSIEISNPPKNNQYPLFNDTRSKF